MIASLVTTSALLTVLVAAGAHAACVSDGEDNGCFTTDAAHSKCEQKAGRGAAKLAASILTCHRNAVDAAARGQPFDEEACETAATQKLVAHTDVTRCPCVSPTSVAALWESLLDASNGTVYCDATGAALGGDDPGHVPVTPAARVCQDAVVKCVAKLVGDQTKCHAAAAAAAVRGGSFDEEACEHGPIPGRPGHAARERYDACVARAVARGGCLGCEDVAGMAALVDDALDGHNDAIYCMDQPTSACPSTYDLTLIGNSVDQDFGWAGFAHDEPLTSGVRLTLAVSGCANAAPPCGQCTLGGPIPNTDLIFANRRCRGADDGSNGTWIQCASDADCPGGGNACVVFLGPPQPLAFGGTGSCFTYEIAAPISGTVDVDTGAAALPLTIAWTPFGLANSQFHPCPRCVAGSCDGGDRQGQACIVNGTSALYHDDVSFDCPPPHAMKIATSTLAMRLTTGTQTATITAASPACRAVGHTTFRCLCDTCDNAAATPCFDDGDCTAVGAIHCGGLRCRGGANDGVPCAAASECPSGACIHPGVPTQPNDCDDAVCTPNTPPDTDSVNEGVCLGGPFDSYCAAEPLRPCVSNADCGTGDTCTGGRLRECFTDNGTIGGSVSVSGVASTTAPTFGALFCAPPSDVAFFDARGLPGLARLTIPGIAVLR